MRLAKSVRFSLDTPLWREGQVVEVDEDTFERLKDRGVFAPADAPTPDPVVPATDVDAPVVDDPAPGRGSARRPKRAASADEWKRFAESQGLSTKGLTKQQIIAAVNK